MNREPSEGQGRRKLKWRDYQTVRGGRPVLGDFRKLTDIEYAEVRVEMEEVARSGIAAARHLRGDIYEVRAETGSGLAVRVLFAAEGKYRKILLSLRVFKKKTRKTPRNEIDVAEDRLRDWRARAAPTGVRGRPSVKARDRGSGGP